MKPFRRVLLLSLAATLLPLAVHARDASLSRSHKEADEGLSVMTLTVRAGSEAIHGLFIEDPTCSVQDLRSPEGWSGVSSGELTIFYSLEKPVAAGRTLTFEVYTTNPQASLSWYVQNLKGENSPAKNL